MEHDEEPPSEDLSFEVFLDPSGSKETIQPATSDEVQASTTTSEEEPAESSVYVDINDVLNFLSPSPRAHPLVRASSLGHLSPTSSFDKESATPRTASSQEQPSPHHSGTSSASVSPLSTEGNKPIHWSDPQAPIAENLHVLTEEDGRDDSGAAAGHGATTQASSEMLSPATELSQLLDGSSPAGKTLCVSIASPTSGPTPLHEKETPVAANGSRPRQSELGESSLNGGDFADASFHDSLDRTLDTEEADRSAVEQALLLLHDADDDLLMGDDELEKSFLSHVNVTGDPSEHTDSSTNAYEEALSLLADETVTEQTNWTGLINDAMTPSSKPDHMADHHPPSILEEHETVGSGDDFFDAVPTPAQIDARERSDMVSPVRRIRETPQQPLTCEGTEKDDENDKSNMVKPVRLEWESPAAVKAAVKDGSDASLREVARPTRATEQPPAEHVDSSGEQAAVLDFRIAPSTQHVTHETGGHIVQADGDLAKTLSTEGTASGDTTTLSFEVNGNAESSTRETSIRSGSLGGSEFDRPVEQRTDGNANVRQSYSSLETSVFPKVPERSDVGSTTAQEWKLSFGRFTSAAASVASSVAHATAPVLADASSIAAGLTVSYKSDPNAMSRAKSSVKDRDDLRSLKLSTKVEFDGSRTVSESDGKRINGGAPTKQASSPLSATSAAGEIVNGNMESSSNAVRSVGTANSWARLAAAAASTAKSAVKVAAPLVAEAGHVASEIVIHRRDNRETSHEQRTSDGAADARGHEFPGQVVDLSRSDTEPRPSGEEAGTSIRQGADRESDSSSSHLSDTLPELPGESPIKAPYRSSFDDSFGPLSPVADATRSKDALSSKIALAAKVFRAKGMQPELPPVLLNRSKRYDASSVSSVSSTMSPGSGRVFPSSGMVSPLVTDEGPSNVNSRRPSLGIRDDAVDARPPLFPRKNKDDVGNPQQLVEFLSRRLGAAGIEKKDAAAVDPPHQSRFMKQSHGTSFDPNESVFVDGDESEASSLSAQGSAWRDDESVGEGDDVSAYDETESAHLPIFENYALAASAWDMIAEQSREGPYSPADNEGRPDFVVMPSPSADESNTNDWAAASFATFSSEFGVSTRSFSRSQRELIDVSVGSRRRKIPGRRLSLSSRGSGRHSVSSRGSRTRRGVSVVGSPTRSFAKGRARLPLNPPFTAEDTDDTSLSAQSLSPEEQASHTGRGLTRKTFSSPNLRINVSPLVSETKSPKLLSPLPRGHEMSFLSNSIRSPSPLRRKVPADLFRSTPPQSSSDDVLLFGRSAEVDMQQGYTLPCDELLLEEELMKFSKTEPMHVDLYGQAQTNRPSEPVVELYWQQLLACWKHAEMMKSLNLCQPSDHFVDHEPDPDPSVTSSLSVVKKDRFQLLLMGRPLCGQSADSVVKNLDGFTPHLGDGFLTPLSDFIGHLKPESGATKLLLRHIASESVSGSTGSLLDMVKPYVDKFSWLVEDLARFGSKNEPFSIDEGEPRTWFSVGLKDATSIERKATIKYDGDCFRVKDVLRARIVFPDDGTLVCSLVRLLWHQEHSSDDSTVRIEIVRVKNLITSSCDSITQSLATGYRHVLVNVRLDGNILAEIQFNLANLYDVLGDEGCILHQKLVYQQGNLERGDEDCLILGRIVEKIVFEGKTFIGSSLPVPANSAHGTSFGEEPSTPRHRNTLSGTPQPGEDNIELPDLKSASAPIIVPRPPVSVEPTLGVTTDAHNPSSLPGGGDTLTFSDEHRIIALLDHGLHQVSRAPRDLAALSCIFVVLLYLLEDKRFEALPSSFDPSVRTREGIARLSTECLLRSLSISFQATSTGMTGWLEHGLSGHFDRMAERPFWLLQRLAAHFAGHGQWRDSEEVLQATLLRCEQHVPLYHPFTLVSLLDLAGICDKKAKTVEARRLVRQLNRRLAYYLTEMERACFDWLHGLLTDGNDEVPVFRINNGHGPLGNLESFGRMLEEQLDRGMLVVLASQPLGTLNRRIVGDAFAVLANCISASERLHDGSSDASARYWRRALNHYKIAFAAKHEDDAVDVYCIAYSIARCLRELGESDRALQLLSTVLGETGTDVIASPSRSFDSYPDVETELLSAAKEVVFTESDRHAHVFLPKSASTHANDDSCMTVDMAMGLCYWLMAVLVVGPDPESRHRAVRRLRAASRSMQHALRGMSQSQATLRAACVAHLQTIEQEAKDLLSGLDPCSPPRTRVPASPHSLR